MTDSDVPEADALEQSEPLDDPEAAVADPAPHLAPDVPEADAIEQAQEVPYDEDDER